MNLLETHDLGKDYGAYRAVDGLSLQVREGSVYGFLGPNGAGKTTTLRMLLGLLRPSRGRATLFGLDCWRDSARIKAEVGYLPGDLQLYPWLTGAVALRMVGRIRRRDIESAGQALAEEFDLNLAVRVRNMSRGMRQKLGLILALAHQPRLLLLDEPTMSLDPVMQSRLKSYLLERSANGQTIFFSSHTLSEVERLCERVAILRHGRLVTETSLDELRQQARRLVTLRWREPVRSADVPLPVGLELVDEKPLLWHCLLAGTAPPILEWLHGKPVADLSISPPDLERIFQQHYES